MQGVDFSPEQVSPPDNHLPAENEQGSPQRSPWSEAKSSTTRKRKPLDFRCSLLASNGEQLTNSDAKLLPVCALGRAVPESRSSPPASRCRCLFSGLHFCCREPRPPGGPPACSSGELRPCPLLCTGASATLARSRCWRPRAAPTRSCSAQSGVLSATGSREERCSANILKFN